MRNKQILLVTLILLLSMLGGALAIAVSAEKTIMPVRAASTFYINGKSLRMPLYKIEGEDYFKLRDLAYILNSGAKKFDVGWNASAKSIKLTSGKSYTATGAEMTTASGKDNKKTYAENITIQRDKDVFKLKAYSISDNYYFAISEISAVLDFSVTYDGMKYFANAVGGWGAAEILLAETADMGQDYLDNIIFLGDSTTYGLTAYGVLSGGKETTQVWVPENKTFSLFNQGSILIQYPETGENITVEKAVQLKNPQYMILTLGVNGVSTMSETDFKKHYNELIGRILESRPDVKVILNSIYPVAKNYANLSKINNDKINAANKWILEIARENGLRYLDTNSLLKGDDGWLTSKYQSGDGLHLNSTAYNIILQYIRTHGYQ